MQKKANRYFIPIDGQAIEVSEEVYRAYYRPISFLPLRMICA